MDQLKQKRIMVTCKKRMVKKKKDNKAKILAIQI